jgi:hypothetical protein
MCPESDSFWVERQRVNPEPESRIWIALAAGKMESKTQSLNNTLQSYDA